MIAFESKNVGPADWLKVLQELFDGGCSYFDFMAATDIGAATVQVVAHVMRPDATNRVMVRTQIPVGAALDSIIRMMDSTSSSMHSINSSFVFIARRLTQISNCGLSPFMAAASFNVRLSNPIGPHFLLILLE